MSAVVRLKLADEAATAALGARLAAVLPVYATGGIVYLRGPLGAGKTCVVRGLLRSLGVTGAVRSPTYTLLELYETPLMRAIHLDLYRLAQAGELRGLGLDDYAPDGWWWLVEWPERGGVQLPPATLEIDLRLVEEGREAVLAGDARMVSMVEAHCS